VEKLYSAIIGTPVFEDDAPRPFTKVKDLVLDPEMRGKLIAFVVNGGSGRILSPVDVISWGNVMKVHSAGDVTEVENVLRVDEVLKKEFHFNEAQVETEKGEKLGHVFDFGVDNKTFDLRRLYVTKSILGFFRYEGRIIPAKDIIEILEDKIVVKEGIRTVKEEAKGTVKDMAAT
jgi:uncharacterized protein YrrD